MELLVGMTEKRIEPDLFAAASRRGERAAFESFYIENQKRVYSVALNFFGGDEQSAKDITQQVFLKIFTSFENFRGEAEVTTWLYRVTVNACIDEQRKSRRLSFFSEFFGFNEIKTRETANDKIHRREICDEVQKTIATLKPKFRLPILLKYVENLSYQEIAEVLECSIGTVSSRLNRGHKMLANKLKHLKGEI